MKKFLSRFLGVLLCAVMVLCSACSNEGPNEGPNGGEGGGNTTPKDEYVLDREAGCNQLTIYYNRKQGYENCDVWLWHDLAGGRGYLFHECEYGAKMMVNVPDTITEVGFIIRTGCSDPGGTSWGVATKDGTDSDRAVTMSGDTVIYTKAEDANSYTSVDGGKTLKVIKYIALADMQDLTHIKINISDNSFVTAKDVTLKDASGNKIEISGVSANLVTVAQPLEMDKSYKLEVTDLDPATVVPLSYFSGRAFGEQYNYDGTLGVEIDKERGTTTFKLWAPTASDVVLNLFANGAGGAAEQNINMTKGEKGVWSHTASSNLSGKYYTYSVTTAIGTNEAVDPYAVSAGVNGQRGMILDLTTTDPEGWASHSFEVANYENYTDAQIWEVHVRDFSNTIASSQYKGKYLAFTETGLKNSHGEAVGIDYLKKLGVTHVHLQPTFDFASVNEADNTDANPDNDTFNWGYDPQNYNVPEGSYATNAADGAVRVNEFKRMVQGLHDAGIGVILDMVYNHTFAADSNLNKVVPYYYYRFNSKGVLSNGSGCGNETASERAMMRKYMIDSVTYWQKEYKVDGFRFDLMGLHDIDTMQGIEQAVHANNPKAIIYGEGWTGGTTTSNYMGATLANLSRLNKSGINNVAMFNDVIRDAIKGSVFDIKDVGFATGANTVSLGGVMFGANGGVYDSALGVSSTWLANDPTNVVNYCSAHDNNTLWDRICYVYGTEADTLNKRLAMNRLSAAIVQTSQGIPFMLAGEEMLRAKVNDDGTYNENSYNASDKVNNIDWEALAEGSAQTEMANYYAGLISFRKAHHALRQTSVKNSSGTALKLVTKTGAFVMFTVTDLTSGEELLVAYNATPVNMSNVALPEGNWDMYIGGNRAGNEVIKAACSGTETFEAISCYVFVKAA